MNIKEPMSEIEINGKPIVLLQKENVPLKVLSEMFSIPLWTLRAWAAQRRFEIYKPSNRIYVNVESFRKWLSQYRIDPPKKVNK